MAVVNPQNFLRLMKTRVIAQMRRASLFGAETREQVDRVAKIVREAGGQNLEGPQIWPSTVLVITRYFLKILMETNLRSAVAEAMVGTESGRGKVTRVIPPLISRFCGLNTAFAISS